MLKEKCDMNFVANYTTLSSDKKIQNRLKFDEIIES